MGPQESCEVQQGKVQGTSTWVEAIPERLGEEDIGISPAEKDLGALIDEKLGMRQKCVLAAQKAKLYPGLQVKQNQGRSTKGILPLCSTQVTPIWSTASSSGIPTQGRYGRLGMSPEEVLEDGLSTSAAKKC